MRAKWAKAHARAQRWAEEVVLLAEEMRRVIMYLDWKATWWCMQATRRVDPARTDIVGGLVAYAFRQSDMFKDISKTFASLWHPILTKANIPIEWSTLYITHAMANPTIPCLGRRRRKAAQPTTPAVDLDSDLDTEGSDSDNLSEDDADVSSYH
jgi:hypothetical protein